MSDHTLSSLRRRARQTGSVEDDSALLVARLRAGTLTRERLELAAYCGDGAAIEALGVPRVAELLAPVVGQTARAYMEHQALGALVGQINAGARPSTFSPWLSGLSRWSDVGPVPGWVLVRASVAAARVADCEWAPERCDGECGTEDERDCPITGWALRAIEAAEAWLADPTNDARWTAWHASYVEAGHLAWLPVPTRASETGARARDAILSATFAGEQPVREAICRSLVEWALSEDA